MHLRISKRISIVGCGWLGLPLLRHLVQQGHELVGTARRKDVLEEITKAGGKAVLADLPQTLPETVTAEAEVIIYALPPGGRQWGERTEERYLNYLEAFDPILSKRDPPHFIFTSSTGVYGQARGTVTESTPLAPDSHSSCAVAAAEAWLTKRTDRLTILRLSGLIGPGRHPGNFYGGKARIIRDSTAPVNLVARADVLRAVDTILINNCPSRVFNVSAGAHPEKGDFYQMAAAELGLRIAGVVGEEGGGGKLISSAALRALGWQPRRDDLALSPSWAKA